MQIKGDPLVTEDYRIRYMVTGEYVNPWTITEEEMDIGDVIHSLSLTNRWRGNTVYPFPVLLHQIMCFDLALNDGVEDIQILKTILEHDNHETYIGDMALPIKIEMYKKFPEYKELDDKLMRMWANKRGLNFPHGEVCDKYDRKALELDYKFLHLLDKEEAQYSWLFTKYYWPFTLNSTQEIKGKFNYPLDYQKLRLTYLWIVTLFDRYNLEEIKNKMYYFWRDNRIYN